jgi:hypothetical protein
MPTRLFFTGGRETTVAQQEDDVVFAIRRDHPNPVSLGTTDGGAVHVNWDHVEYFEEVREGVQA